jgi:hypothetical protein
MSKEKSKGWKSYGNKLPSNDKECFYCGSRLWEGNRTTDHIIPKSKGGILSNDNKVYCCKRCNGLKQDHSVEDFEGIIKFMVREMDKDHEAKMEYYRNILISLEKLRKNKKANGKTAKGISSDKG